MKYLQLGLIILSVFVADAVQGGEIALTQKRIETDKSENAAHAYSAASKLAQGGDPAGFLKLYEIASDDITYTVEYSEMAYDELSLLLYSNTKTWVKTFAKIDQLKFRKRFNGVNDAQLPKGISTSEKFFEGIRTNLKGIKGSDKEMDLVTYLLGLI